MGRRHDNLVWAASLGLAAAGGYLIPSITAGVPLVRPLFGVLNSAALAIARHAGWETVLWRREGHDWQARATADSIARRLTRKVRAGDVLLLHDADFYSAPDSWRNTVASLPLVLEELE